MKYVDEQLTGSDDFEAKMGEDFTKKVILSILKTQAELIRSYNFPVGSGGYISFYGDTLVWSLVGSKASKEKKAMFAKRADYKDIMKFAINSFEKNRLFNGAELSLVERELQEFTVEIFPIRVSKDEVTLPNKGLSPYLYIKRLLISLFE